MYSIRFAACICAGKVAISRLKVTFIHELTVMLIFSAPLHTHTRTHTCVRMYAERRAFFTFSAPSTSICCCADVKLRVNGEKVCRAGMIFIKQTRQLSVVLEKLVGTSTSYFHVLL